MRIMSSAQPDVFVGRRHSGLNRWSLAFVLLVSILFPPILLFAAWRLKNPRQIHWLLTLFVGWYAVSLPIAYDPLGAGSDGVRHLLAVYVFYTDMSLERFLSDLWDILLFRGSGSSNDVFRHVIAYVTGGVIGMPSLFFPVVGLFYGYFFVGSMMIVFLGVRERRWPLVVIFLALCFFLSRNIESLQAVRNPTAGWVLIYGILRFQQTRKPKYVALMACTPLIHFSFLLLALPAFAYLILGNRQWLYASIFALSVPFNFVTPDVAIDLISEVEIGEQKLRDRTDWGQRDADSRAQIIESQMQGGARMWRAYMMAGYQSIALNVLAFGMILSGAYFVMGRFAKAIFSNGLLMLTASNSLWFLGGATGRLWGLGFLLVMAGFIIWRLGEGFSLKRIVFSQGYVVSCYLSAILFIPYFLFYLSRILDYINIFAFSLPLLASMYPDANLTLKEVFRGVLPI